MTASKPVRLGMVQFVPATWDVKGNWVRLKRILRGIPAGQMDLVITPECILDGYAVRGAPKDAGVKWAERERWLRELSLIHI